MSQADFTPYLECSIALAVDLVNTRGAVSGDDTLDGTPALVEFVASHTVSGVRRATRRDLGEVLTLRAKLRSVFEAPDEPAAVAILNELLAESGARPELTNHNNRPWHIHYSPPGASIAPMIAADAAMALAVVIAEDGFERLRRCEGERCDDVFVDESKNRSRRYCSPSVCGNRASVAAFRARQKAGRAGA